MVRFLFATVLLFHSMASAQIFSWPTTQQPSVPAPWIKRWWYGAATGNGWAEVGVQTVRTGDTGSMWSNAESNTIYMAEVVGRTSNTSGNNVRIISYGISAIDKANTLAGELYLESTSDVRFWFANGGGDFALQDNPTSFRSIAFRYSTAAGDSTLKCYAANGSSSTIVDTGLLTVGTPSKLRIVRVSSGLAEYYVNNIKVCSITTNLPTGAVASPKIYLTTLASTDKAMHIYWLYGEGVN